MRPIDLIVVHCSATPPRMDIGAAEIRKWHRAKGWSDIGYHKIIRRNGDVEEGRDESAIGAHARGHNATSLGVCLVGGVDVWNDPEDNFESEQFQSLFGVLKDWQSRFPGAKILGHRDLPGVNKACPAFDVGQRIDLNLLDRSGP